MCERSLENACHNLSALEVCSRQGDIQINAYLTLPYLSMTLALTLTLY